MRGKGGLAVVPRCGREWGEKRLLLPFLKCCLPLTRHATCNNYRWDYLPEEFQWTLKIGVWARLVMEKQDGLGQAMTRGFAAHERTREQRQRRK